ncbi:hypothetical protein VaNZ11_011906 [Volvox africanus]|uniref:Protein kinase domain-containing protein n=1 Tax=Volvox africanus TaxID=51714 RepID=A0ABQ5SEP7_9CHLO|nr:hypothetical protein VaNZ11_011906 [Volvox africanus]
MMPVAEALGTLSPGRRALMALGAQLGMRIGLLVTPFAEMGNLRDITSDPQRSPFRVRPGWGPVQACKAFLATACEVAEALGCLHSAGLVHRALKPSNVLLFAAADDSRGFEARVTDVGAASRAAAAGWAQWDPSAMATDPWVAAFLAPETVYRPWASVAAQMFPASRSSDVFAMGALMLTMLIGHPPSHSGSGHMATSPPAPTVAGDGDVAFQVSECACAAGPGGGDDISCSDGRRGGEGSKAPPHLQLHGSLQLLISRCMATEPTSRTSIDQVVSELRRLQQEQEAEAAERGKMEEDREACRQIQ